MVDSQGLGGLGSKHIWETLKAWDETLFGGGQCSGTIPFIIHRSHQISWSQGQ